MEENKIIKENQGLKNQENGPGSQTNLSEVEDQEETSSTPAPTPEGTEKTAETISEENSLGLETKQFGSEDQSYQAPTPPITPNETKETRTAQEDPHDIMKKTWTFKPKRWVNTFLENVIEENPEISKSAAVNELFDMYNAKIREQNELIQKLKQNSGVVRETVKEVEKALDPNQLVLSFSPDQLRLLEMIHAKRQEFRIKRNIQGNETMEGMIKKSFFIPGRLFNLDNEFYTGLKKSDLK